MANSIPQLASMARIDGAVSWYNQRWYEYTGKTQEEMEDRGWQDVVPPGILQEIMAHWQRAIDTGEPFEMEFPIRRADGEFRAFLNRVQPLRNADGQIVNWFGTNTDVETLKQAEDGLRRSQEQLAGIISSAMDAIITVDSDQRIVLFNTAAETMFACPAGDALGKSLERFIPGRFRSTHHDHIRDFGKTNVTRTFKWHRSGRSSDSGPTVRNSPSKPRSRSLNRLGKNTSPLSCAILPSVNAPLRTS